MTDKKYEELDDIEIPEGYKWLFRHFLEIWRGCEYDLNGNSIFTYRSITDYSECMHVNFSIEEKRIFMYFKLMAYKGIKKAKSLEE